MVSVVPGVPGITTSNVGAVLARVEIGADGVGSVEPAGIIIVEVKDDKTGECCTVTGTTFVDVEDVTIGERCTVIGNTVFRVEVDKAGAGLRMTGITVFNVVDEGFDAGRCEVTGTTVVKGVPDPTEIEVGDGDTTTTSFELAGEEFGAGCISVKVTGTTRVEVVDEGGGADCSNVTGTRTVEVDEVRIGAGGVTVATKTVTIVEDDTISMTEPVGEREGAASPAFYAIGVPELTVEGRGTTIGGPAVATTGRTETGEEREELSGREPPEPICVPWSVKLAQVRRVLSEE